MFRAARGLLPGSHACPSDVPRHVRFKNITETTPPTFPEREPVGGWKRDEPRRAIRSAVCPASQAAGFLPSDIRPPQEETGWSLFLDVQIFTGTLQDDTLTRDDGMVGVAGDLPASVAYQHRFRRREVPSLRVLRFEPCDH